MTRLIWFMLIACATTMAQIPSRTVRYIQSAAAEEDSVQYDAGSIVSNASDEPVSSLTLTDQTVASNTDRLNLVFVGWNSALGEQISSVAKDVEVFTQHGSTVTFDDFSFALFKYVNPAAATNDIVITPDADTRLGAACIALYNVDQANPLGTEVTNTGNGTSSSVNVTTAGTDLVIDGIRLFAVDATLTVGAGQTEHVNFPSPNVKYVFGASSERHASSSTMSWTISGSPIIAWIHFAVNVKNH
jgi:hypothetical protein